MKIVSTVSAQTNKRKEIPSLWAIVGSIAQFHSKMVGLSKAKKNLNLACKEKDSNFVEKKSSMISKLNLVSISPKAIQ